MADSLEINQVDAPRAGPNSGQGRAPVQQVSVTFDADAGTAHVPGEAKAPARVDRSALLAKHQARIDAARGAPPEATHLNDRGQPVAAAQVEEPPAEVDPVVDGGDPEGDPVEAELEGAPPADPDPEPDAAEKPAEDPAYRYELEQARNEAAALRQRFDDYVRGGRKQEFETYFDDPVTWLKSKVAEVLESKADDPLVQSEVASLFGELTWNSVGVQDLPEAQQFQLRGERAERRTRLDQHTRQAARRAGQVSQETDAARNFTESVYQAVKGKYPAAALAERRYGRPIRDLVLARLPSWLESGQIRGLDTKTPGDLITEAIRLFDLESRKWVTDEIGPLLAHLNPASAPATPGASSPAAAVKAPDKPQAAPKGQPDKPRTLAAAKVGAAPSRPAGAPKQEEQLSRDPEIRRRQVLERAQRR